MGTNQVVAPVLMQRQCDGGKGDMPAEEWAKCIAARLTEGAPIQGCGTWFQWYWGMNCICPTCSRHWIVTVEHQKRYRVLEPVYQSDERAMEDRILRNILMRLGR